MQLEQIVDHAEQKLLGSRSKARSPASVIGELVMEQLRKVDEVAYVWFASVYRQFKDINTFMEELNTLLKGKYPAGMAGVVPPPFFSYRKEDGFMDERLQKQLNFHS